MSAGDSYGYELAARLGRPLRSGEVFAHRSVRDTRREWICVRKDGSRFVLAMDITAIRADDGRLRRGIDGVDVRPQHRQAVRAVRHLAGDASERRRRRGLRRIEMRHPRDVVLRRRAQRDRHLVVIHGVLGQRHDRRKEDVDRGVIDSLSKLATVRRRCSRRWDRCAAWRFWCCLRC